MRILAIIVFCLLTNGVDGFDLFGIGKFFGSTRRSVERLTSVVEGEAREYRNILNRDVIPEVRETLKALRMSAEEVVKLADRLEGRIEETLKKVDELIVRTGYRMDNMADLIIILCMAFMFFVVSSICDNKQVLFLYYTFQFIRGTCVLTAMMLMVRLICELVLRVHMSTAATIKYCIIAPVVFIFVMVVLNMVYKALQPVGLVLIFVLKWPRLLIYCTVDGPCKWTYGAYLHGPEMESKKGIFLSICLPWLTLLIWIVLFNLLAGDTNDDDLEHLAILVGLLGAYLFFLACAYYLRAFYIRPEPRAHMRSIYSKKDDHVPQKALVSGQGSVKRPITGKVKYRR